MNFLIDANLPRRLIKIFTEYRHSAIHILDLPQGNTITDKSLLSVAEEKKCVGLPKIPTLSHFLG